VVEVARLVVVWSRLLRALKTLKVSQNKVANYKWAICPMVLLFDFSENFIAADVESLDSLAKRSLVRYVLVLLNNHMVGEGARISSVRSERILMLPNTGERELLLRLTLDLATCLEIVPVRLAVLMRLPMLMLVPVFLLGLYDEVIHIAVEVLRADVEVFDVCTVLSGGT